MNYDDLCNSFLPADHFTHYTHGSKRVGHAVHFRSSTHSHTGWTSKKGGGHKGRGAEARGTQHGHRVKGGFHTHTSEVICCDKYENNVFFQITILWIHLKFQGESALAKGLAIRVGVHINLLRLNWLSALIPSRIYEHYYVVESFLPAFMIPQWVAL